MSDKAVVQRFRRAVVGHMVTQERARLPCGCCIFVGLDRAGEATTGARPCSAEHTALTERASELLRESTKRPTRRLLVDVCATLLTQAAREQG